MELLRNVKRGVVEMVTTKRKLEIQASKVQANVSKLDSQAKQAIGVGRDDLARIAIERKQAAISELEGLGQQISGLELEQEKLAQAEQRLQAKVNSFKSKKELIKAQYTAAQAQVRIGSALSGLSEEMGDISLSIERAETKTDTLRAKAGAIDELAAAGVLDDPISGSKDDLTRQLEHISAVTGVEAEMESIKASLSSDNRKSLPEGQS
jgi:phage shock protein A